MASRSRFERSQMHVETSLKRPKKERVSQVDGPAMRPVLHPEAINRLACAHKSPYDIIMPVQLPRDACTFLCLDMEQLRFSRIQSNSWIFHPMLVESVPRARVKLY